MNSKNIWEAAPISLKLSDNEVHIWRVSVQNQSEYLERLKSVLSDEEKDRYKRFHFEKDSKRYIVARGLLRIILSRYFDNLDPRDINFSFNRFGKPNLDIPIKNSIQFNVSHSGDMVLYAITNGHEVGIDVEYIKPMNDADQIVSRFFSEHEKKEYIVLPENLKNRAFFTCWTRKEAFIKAVGEGLSHPLDKFSVTLKPGEPARIIHMQNKQNANWFMKEILLDNEYVAAAVIDSDDLNFHYWEWSWSE